MTVKYVHPPKFSGGRAASHAESTINAGDVTDLETMDEIRIV